MARSSAPTVASYLAELPAPRREALAAVRDVILSHLPDGYEETMGFGMICYGVPLSDYPDTYNGQPLCYAALAAQKSFNTVYLMNAYAGGQLAALERGFAEAGLRLDMGKSCVHFQTASDLPLDTIGAVIGSTPPARWIEIYEASRSKGAAKRGGTKAKAGGAKKAGGTKRRGATKGAGGPEAATKKKAAANKKTAKTKAAARKGATRKRAATKPARKR